MNKLLAVLAVSLLGITLSVAPCLAQEAISRQPLNVLYVGSPSHERATEFVTFLETRFEKTGAIALAELSAETAAEWDVVVIDLPNDLPDNELIAFYTFELSDFDRPTVLVGPWGARLGERLGLNIHDG